MGWLINSNLTLMNITSHLESAWDNKDTSESITSMYREIYTVPCEVHMWD